MWNNVTPGPNLIGQMFHIWKIRPYFREDSASWAESSSAEPNLPERSRIFQDESPWGRICRYPFDHFSEGMIFSLAYPALLLFQGISIPNKEEREKEKVTVRLLRTWWVNLITNTPCNTISLLFEITIVISLKKIYYFTNSSQCQVVDGQRW